MKNVVIIGIDLLKYSWYLVFDRIFCCNCKLNTSTGCIDNNNMIFFGCITEEIAGCFWRIFYDLLFPFLFMNRCAKECMRIYVCSGFLFYSNVTTNKINSLMRKEIREKKRHQFSFSFFVLKVIRNGIGWLIKY